MLRKLHLSTEIMRDYRDGSFTKDQDEKIILHLSGCRACGKKYLGEVCENRKILFPQADEDFVALARRNIEELENSFEFRVGMIFRKIDMDLCTLEEAKREAAGEGIAVTLGPFNRATDENNAETSHRGGRYDLKIGDVVRHIERDAASGITFTVSFHPGSERVAPHIVMRARRDGMKYPLKWINIGFVRLWNDNERETKFSDEHGNASFSLREAVENHFEMTGSKDYSYSDFRNQHCIVVDMGSIE
ncbi:MAG: hypothetical protein ABIG42_04845 [bacterium]